MSAVVALGAVSFLAFVALFGDLFFAALDRWQRQ